MVKDNPRRALPRATPPPRRLHPLHAARGHRRLSQGSRAESSSAADVYPGAQVVEAGAGSGACVCPPASLRAWYGQLTSYERREDFAAIAGRNVERFFGGPHPTWDLAPGTSARL